MARLGLRHEYLTSPVNRVFPKWCITVTRLPWPPPAPGACHCVRNAGGRASDDALRSIAISQRLLGTRVGGAGGWEAALEWAACAHGAGLNTCALAASLCLLHHLPMYGGCRAMLPRGQPTMCAALKALCVTAMAVCAASPAPRRSTSCTTPTAACSPSPTSRCAWVIA